MAPPGSIKICVQPPAAPAVLAGAVLINKHNLNIGGGYLGSILSPLVISYGYSKGETQKQGSATVIGGEAL
jgi:hypothetical protein